MSYQDATHNTTLPLLKDTIKHTLMHTTTHENSFNSYIQTVSWLPLLHWISLFRYTEW